MNDSPICIGLRACTFVIQRHCHAAKAVTDEARELSLKGLMQRQAVTPLIDAIGPFDVILSSPVWRAWETVSRETIEMVKVPALYFPAEGSPERTIIDTVYDEIGNAPLRQHLATEAGVALAPWAIRAAGKVIIEALTKRPSTTTVLIGCHGVYSQALAMQLALYKGLSPELALTTVLAEGDALVLDQNGIRHLACPAVE